MTQIILVLLLMIAIGVFIYITKYKDGKPKVGIKRNNYSDYFKDYSSLKLYWTSICFIFFGIAMLIAILILEIVFI